jgi:hypothetical protein
LERQEQAMSTSKVQEIERVIGTLTKTELEELQLWLDEFAGPLPLDTRIEEDLADGQLDRAVQRALDDEKQGNVTSL